MVASAYCNRMHVNDLSKIAFEFRVELNCEWKTIVTPEHSEIFKEYVKTA